MRRAYLSSFLVWCLNFVHFMLKMILFYEFILSAKIIHQHIGNHRLLLINIGLSETLQYAFAESDLVLRVPGY